MRSAAYPIDIEDLRDEDVYGYPGGQKHSRNKELVLDLGRGGSVRDAKKKYDLSSSRIQQIWMYTYFRQERRKSKEV